MSRNPAFEPMPADLSEHRAVKAWRMASGERFRPARVEALKLKKKSAVYRLTAAGGRKLIAKRCETGVALVESVVYQDVLARLPLPALRWYGLAREDDGGSSWLFLEDAGARAYLPEEPSHRAVAGRWLGAIHRAGVAESVRAALPDRGLAHYHRQIRQARAGAMEQMDHRLLAPPQARTLRILIAQLGTIESHWGEFESFYEGRRPALVHGDFASKNLRILEGRNGPALLVFDWEMSGWGLPATDFAQGIGGCASPDLDAYDAAIGEGSPVVSGADRRRLAAFGGLLRLLDTIYWVTLSWSRQPADADPRWWLVRPILTLERYRPRLEQALADVGWTRHD